MRFSSFRFGQASADLSRALLDLSEELRADRRMRIRITEPVFFQGEERKQGDVLNNVQVGPFRTQIIPGGLQRIPQFVEMPEEIKDVLHIAATDVGNVSEVLPEAVKIPVPVQTKPAPASFAEATAAVLKPAAAAIPISRTAATLSALAARRRKLEETIGNEAAVYAQQLDEIEAAVPSTFTKAKQSLDDRRASLGEISDSLKELANGPLGS